ncbi:hypothetical protein PALB_27490 [Pseudoalteromonas luteoviolacea B = ATCC 29581]|nr:hypothetical protein PALB_27490 [Pseudoalteromonas luteoviolacea B = ATCC 29581]
MRLIKYEKRVFELLNRYILRCKKLPVMHAIGITRYYKKSS